MPVQRRTAVQAITTQVASPLLADCGRSLGVPSEQNLYKFWYTIAMTDPVVIHVHPLSEVRQRLSGILARFRREGAAVALWGPSLRVGRVADFRGCQQARPGDRPGLAGWWPASGWGVVLRRGGWL
jgi:hypothetical protein